MATFTEIPEVSAASWRHGDADSAAADLVRVCHEVGFFTLVDHGIERSFLDRHFALLQSFFALPREVKQRIAKVNSPYFRGWEDIGSELTDNKIDHREQLDISSENPPHPARTTPAYLRIDGPNQWLAESALPGFRETALEYFGFMSALANELMSVLARGLGLPPTTFQDRFGERPYSIMKLISYPTTPRGEAGVNGHNDVGFITLLLQHGVGGLQALNPDGEWIDVPPRDDAFVVNLGEMLQSMTGNYLVATKHRVIADQPRFSSAYFHGPDLRASLAPLELHPRFAETVAASPRHRDAGFMAKRDELLAGASGTNSTSAALFGEQIWNYYTRSYPDLVAAHHADVVG
jgi:isopenicillin N synthase-like dioxygenase